MFSAILACLLVVEVQLARQKHEWQFIINPWDLFYIR